MYNRFHWQKLYWLYTHGSASVLIEEFAVTFGQSGPKERPDMPTFSVLTVDDDAAARKRLRDLLSLDAECELAGEFSNGAEAISRSGRADIMVVEVEMPDMNGFEVVRRMPGETPLVIFTSRHAEYAARAFEARAFDYLIKPLAEARFHDSLIRARVQIMHNRTTSFESFESLLRRRQAPQRVAIRKNGRVIFVTLEEIDWIEAADNYVCLHCGGETHVLRETIREMEARLDPARFVRVHRSAIVNIDRIKELQPWFRGDYRVILLDGTELTLTKNHREKLDSQLLLGSFAT
jgi:two-component system, LytTR family, response regulator